MAKLHYMGAYRGAESQLPFHDILESSVLLKEGTDFKKTGNFIQALSAIVLLILLFFLIWVGRGVRTIRLYGFFLSLLTILPHEILHGICFPGEAQIFSSWENGLFFVTGPGEFSRHRFIFTALLPNLVFGFIPLLLFLIAPSCSILGTMGAFCIAAGVGDYLSIYHVLTQVPRHAKLYTSGNTTWWYIPK